MPLDEWCCYIKQVEIDNGTVMGRMLSVGDEVINDYPEGSKVDKEQSEQVEYELDSSSTHGMLETEYNIKVQAMKFLA